MLTVYSYLLFLVSLSLSAQLKGEADETLIDVPDKDLITRIPNQKESEKCCNEDNLLTCESVNVDPDMLMQEDDISILGIPFTFSNRIEPNGFAYKTETGDEAVITYREVTGNMFGGVKTREGRSFAVEKCKGGHVLKEYDVASFGGDEGVHSTEDVMANVSRGYGYDPDDKTTWAYYSIMLYYTPEVEENVEDLIGFIQQVRAETNQGYINSRIPVQIGAICYERATVHDIPNDIGRLFEEFSAMKGSDAALRNTADAAALITWELTGKCGRAYTNSFKYGNTFSVTKKSCATGYFSFGHEIAHNFGCHHNPEQYPYDHTPSYPSAYGHLIAAGTASTGVRSILAYNAEGHYKRVNYYSNPDVIYPGTGTPTGVAGISNNAKVITDNRFEFADVGDESSRCFNPVPTSTAEPEPTTYKPDVYENYIPIIDRKAKRYSTSEKTWEACESLCRKKDCAAMHFRERKKQCFLQMVTYRTKNNYISGQNQCRGAFVKESDAVPIVRKAKKYKMANGSWEDCKALCWAYSCTTWSFKDNKKAKKRLCFLQTVEFKKRNNYISGYYLGCR